VKLLTVAQLPPLIAYLDYLALRYAMHMGFLPADHALVPNAAYSSTSPRGDYPSRLRMTHLTHAIAAGSVVEERFRQVLKLLYTIMVLGTFMSIGKPPGSSAAVDVMAPGDGS
jgi:hypothetical protein